MKNHIFTSLIVVVGLSLAVTACGRDRSTRGPGGPVVPPTGGSSLILAAEGGTVSVADTETQLSLPANALAEDTEIVLSITGTAGYPTREGLVEVLEITPQGTSLELAASLSWQPSAVTLTGSEELSLVRLVDGSWSTVEASVTVGSGGIASTQITSLDTYGLIVAGEPIDPPVEGTGSISGQVLHIYTEEPLSGIEFRLFDSFEGEHGTAISDTSGAFTFSNLAPGSYFVLANVSSEENCFGDPTEMNVEVTEGGTASVFFGFVPGPCE